ncbi:hypothetical protein ACHAO3_004054 [Verticillium nonalfalfae]
MTTENDYDGIQSDTTSNIWIDHCLLENGGDGLLDLRKDTTFFTVSNNIFRNHDKAFGIGWTENVVARGTIHHNWFDRTNQRNSSADNLAQCHLYNNYVLEVTSYGHYARGSTNARVENVYFESCRNPLTKDSGAILNASGNIYQAYTGTVAANSGTAFQPRDYYSYTLTATADVPSYVKANAGPRASPALVNATDLAVQKRDDRGYYRSPQHWNNYNPWPPEYWQWGFLNCKNVLELDKRPTATCEYYFENCPGNTHISFTISIEPNGETNPNWCAVFYDYIADECGSPRIHWTRCNTHFMSDLDGHDGISVDFDFTPDFPVEKFNDGCIQAAVRRATCDTQLEHVTMANGGCVFVGSCEDNVDPFKE